MTQRFLITGLPRSRTAWFAEVCTTAHSVCYHEPLKGFQHWRDVYELWAQPGYVGVSDSAMGFHLGEILDRAAPRTLLVVRDIDEVEDSLRSQGLPVMPRYCHVLQNRLYGLIEHPLVRTIRFEELENIDAVEICLQHLMPGLPIDMDRLDLLMDVNIQADTQEVRKHAAQRSGNLEALFGVDVLEEIRNRG